MWLQAKIQDAMPARMAGVSFFATLFNMRQTNFEWSLKANANVGNAAHL